MTDKDWATGFDSRQERVFLFVTASRWPLEPTLSLFQ
jgi:hypothetical protein